MTLHFGYLCKFACKEYGKAYTNYTRYDIEQYNILRNRVHCSSSAISPLFDNI